MKPFEAGQTYRCAIATEVLKIHILGVHDNEYVAYKYYSVRKKRWIYRIEWDQPLKTWIYIANKKTAEKVCQDRDNT